MKRAKVPISFHSLVRACPKCGSRERKPVAPSEKVNGKRDGKCAPCARKTMSRWHETPLGRARNLWSAARERDRNRGREFTLDLELVEEWCERGICAVTGIELDFSMGHGKQYRPLRLPSLDRITKGPYTNTNARLVCWGWNALKGTSTDADAWGFTKQARRNRRASN